MKRTRKKPDWHTIGVRTSPQVRAALAQLVNTGFFGCAIEDAAERIICQRIEHELYSRDDAGKWNGLLAPRLLL